jgi:leucyl-tRNA---protein transferase
MGNPVTLLANVRVFATYPHNCSYLPGEQATTLFVDPSTRIDSRMYSQLSNIGFRRSGPHLYRPHCVACNACVPARVNVEHFRLSRSQRRIMQRNADLEVREIERIDTAEHFALYSRYIHERHRDGDMYPPDREQFNSFLTREWGCTRFVEFRDTERPLAVAVLDQIESGLSAIYTFFDPDQSQRSLGTHVILWQIERARQLDLPALYLGYWIRNCRKMNYKTKFRPIELLVNGKWTRVD